MNFREMAKVDIYKFKAKQYNNLIALLVPDCGRAILTNEQRAELHHIIEELFQAGYSLGKRRLPRAEIGVKLGVKPPPIKEDK